MASQITEIELESVQLQIIPFKQMKYQSVVQPGRYSKQGKEELARMISVSL
jgi:hypothetical protein